MNNNKLLKKNQTTKKKVNQVVMFCEKRKRTVNFYGIYFISFFATQKK